MYFAKLQHWVNSQSAMDGSYSLSDGNVLLFQGPPGPPGQPGRAGLQGQKVRPAAFTLLFVCLCHCPESLYSSIKLKPWEPYYKPGPN